MTNHNDKEYLINQLKNMPKIEDQQSKEQLYQKIQRKLNHNQSVLSKKRVAVWIPTLASICSIILLFIIIQTQNFSNQSDQSSSNSAEDSSMESAKLENSDQTGESSIAEDQDESKSINNSQDTEAVEEESSQKLDQMYNYMINIKNESAVYTAFITEQAQHIVPVTLLNSKEETYSNYIEQIDGQINLDQNGLYDIGIKDMEFTIEEAIVRARFNNTFDVIASGSNISNFEWILAYMFQPLDISEISFENNHSIAEELGAIENPYSLLETKQTPYKLYQADNTGSSEWLVPITNNQYKTLNSALEEMKNNEQTFLVWATIPNDANIAVENLAENHVFVSISSKQIGDNQLTVSMVESILATAYTYGFQQVTLDIGLDQIGKYDLTAPIDTTNQINIVDLNEAAS